MKAAFSVVTFRGAPGARVLVDRKDGFQTRIEAAKVVEKKITDGFDANKFLGYQKLPSDRIDGVINRFPGQERCGACLMELYQIAIGFDPVTVTIDNKNERVAIIETLET